MRVQKSKNPSSKNALKEAQKFAGSPERVEPRLYRDARPGYSTAEVTRRTFTVNEDFVDDLDDENQLDAKLTEAGVEFSPEESDRGKVDPENDREFELKRMAEESRVQVLDDEDLDLDQLPRVGTIKVDDGM